MSVGENIRRLREKYQLSQEDMARIAGTTNKAVSTWEKGTREPRMGAIQAIADHFNLRKSDIIDGVVDAERPLRVPVLGTIMAGIPMYAVENILDYEEIPAALAVGGEYFALKIKEHSMEPRICEGDVVIVRRQDNVDTGDVAIVLVNGDEATIKRIKKSPNGITLIANNVAVYEPHFYSNSEILTVPVRVIGKVVELRGKL
ncbi:MAG: XRE family transcriptional regulator [Acidaminococcus sp.]|uniref:Helix-turn-helix domain-containing protein n=1 Tax=Acidaminococcus intestini TaxID=187327 RepID=A0A943EED0_9FIRM|nr:XRE family transcriptional regulator [Acidaminococcus sp.]MBS5520136.1 helix-turn-helix domain-containing protein [Acidaminococcus intestini]MDY2738326.1 XRE family transcriptional regulator [Acidaminococcus sp.]